MRKRNTVPVVLMVSSILLLLLLQGLWLVNSYDNAYNDLHRQTTEIFRGTLLNLRDSIFLRSYESVTRDSAGRIPGMVVSMDIMTAGPNVSFFRKEVPESVRMFTFQERAQRSEIHINRRSATDTTTSNVVRGFAHSSTSMTNDGQRITIRFAPDSITTDTLKYYFKSALAKSELPLNFEIATYKPAPLILTDGSPGVRRRMSPSQEEPPAPKGTMTTEWVRFSPFFQYASVFDSVKPYVFRQIFPQIIFSFALTLVTATAFLLMYRSMRAQQKLMELKNDFISNITHELKTPVTTVSVALEALRNFKGLENPQTTREYLDIAQGELNRLTLLTDKVLKTAAFENGKVSFERESVDLHKTVDQILHSMKLIFEKQKARVSFEQTGTSFVIYGGSVHLTNVIYNLLDNALKYGGINPEISIRLEEGDNKVVLKVADRGIGIPTEYKKKIFEKFFRVPNGDVHNVKGYGLGLSYVDSVIRSHKGVIDVISVPGQGSEFVISLPKDL